MAARTALLAAGIVAGAGMLGCAPGEEQNEFRLPEPHANNAVAIGAIPGGNTTIYSFYGLKSGKTYADVSTAAYRCVVRERRCEAIASPPVADGRLASVAVFLRDRVYLFGGYTVAEDGTEVSTPEVFAFDAATEEYQRRADMPVPVDDAVAVPYADRYIYLVSGWHDDGNVSEVQVFDALEDRWFPATPYPGAPVFGHAGGAVKNKIVVADGVAVIGEQNGRRQFGETDEVWVGEIDPADPSVIAWRPAPAHPFGPLYRMAAAGEPARDRVVFAGGGDNPYNFNGLGYDGTPAKPSDRVFAFDLDAEEWRELGRLPSPSMDHRGLLIDRDQYFIVGGMDEDLRVRGRIMQFEIRGEQP